jgi:hypothetical protein
VEQGRGSSRDDARPSGGSLLDVADEAGRVGDGEDRPGGRFSTGRPAGPDDLRPGDGPEGTKRVNGRHPALRHQPAGTGPAAGAAEEPGEHDPEAPIWNRHRPPLYYQPRVILAVLIVVVFVGAVALSSRHGQWPPKANCERVAITSSVEHVRQHYPVYWAATGGAGRYAVTIGATKVAVSGGRVTVAGSEANAGAKAAVVQQPTPLTGCRLLGHFAMPLPSGEYSLRLFRIDGDTATQVGRTRVDSDG